MSNEINIPQLRLYQLNRTAEESCEYIARDKTVTFLNNVTVKHVYTKSMDNWLKGKRLYEQATINNGARWTYKTTWQLCSYALKATTT